MDSIKVGKFIALLRKQKGYSQRELGDILGVSSKTISKWECGNGLPDISMLKKIGKVLDITIDELLDGDLKNKDKMNKGNIDKKKFKFIGILLTIIMLVLFIKFIIMYKNKNGNDDNLCTVIRTYYIDNIGKSNDDNYLYITLHEFQVEGNFTIKLSKLMSNELEVGNSYEFTFKTSEDYLMASTDRLFDNSEVINLKHSEKQGLDITSTYYCNDYIQ